MYSSSLFVCMFMCVVPPWTFSQSIQTFTLDALRRGKIAACVCAWVGVWVGGCASQDRLFQIFHYEEFTFDQLHFTFTITFLPSHNHSTRLRRTWCAKAFGYMWMKDCCKQRKSVSPKYDINSNANSSIQVGKEGLVHCCSSSKEK